MNLANPKGWTAFWFLNGGMLHGMWKRRHYSGIYEMARNLPKLAWDTCEKEQQELLEREKERSAVLLRALEAIACPPDSDRRDFYGDIARAALLDYAGEKKE